MDFSKIKERSNGVCELCYMERAVHMHHSLMGSKRKAQESIESVYHLGERCHTLVHKDRLVNLLLIFTTQNRYISQGIVADQLRNKMGGMIYSEDDILKVDSNISGEKVEKIMEGI